MLLSMFSVEVYPYPGFTMSVVEGYSLKNVSNVSRPNEENVDH